MSLYFDVQLEIVPPQNDKPVSDEVRAQLDELLQENRSLKRSLTDAQTTLALQRSEVAGVKAQWEEKCYELDKYVAICVTANYTIHWPAWCFLQSNSEKFFVHEIS